MDLIEVDGFHTKQFGGNASSRYFVCSMTDFGDGFGGDFGAEIVSENAREDAKRPRGGVGVERKY